MHCAALAVANEHHSLWTSSIVQWTDLKALPTGQILQRRDSAALCNKCNLHHSRLCFSRLRFAPWSTAISVRSPIFPAAFCHPTPTIHLDLEPGSLLVMSHATQRHFDHDRAKVRIPVGPRISVAFRRLPAKGHRTGRELALPPKSSGKTRWHSYCEKRSRSWAR